MSGKPKHKCPHCGRRVDFPELDELRRWKQQAIPVIRAALRTIEDLGPRSLRGWRTSCEELLGKEPTDV